MVIEVTARVKLDTVGIDQAERRCHPDADECELAAGTEQQARFDRCRPSVGETSEPGHEDRWT